MEARTKVGIIGIPVLIVLFLALAFAYYGVEKLIETAPIILPLIAGAIVALGIYSFRPKEKIDYVELAKSLKAMKRAELEAEDQYHQDKIPKPDPDHGEGRNQD